MSESLWDVLTVAMRTIALVVLIGAASVFLMLVAWKVARRVLIVAVPLAVVCTLAWVAAR